MSRQEGFSESGYITTKIVLPEPIPISDEDFKKEKELEEKMFAESECHMTAEDGYITTKIVLPDPIDEKDAKVSGKCSDKDSV